MAAQRQRKLRLSDIIRTMNAAGESALPPPAAHAEGDTDAPRDAATVSPPAPRLPRDARPGRPAPPHPAGAVTSGDDDDDEGIDVFKYLAILARRKNVIITAACIASGIAAYSYITAPRFYVAHARLLFTPGYQELTSDYAGAWQNWISRERLLTTHLELLRSRAVMALLSENLDGALAPDMILGGLTVARGATNGQANDLIELSYRHPDATMARNVLNELCRSYLEYRREVDGQEHSRLIFKLQGQIERQQNDLQISEDALRGFKETHRMVRLSDETNISVTRLSGMETALQQTRLELLEARQRLNSLRTSIGQQQVDVVQSITYDNAFQGRLADLELQLNTLSAEYSPEHYRVRIVQQQLDTLRRAMERDVQSRVARQTTYIKNPVRQSLLEEMIKLTIHHATLETRRQTQEHLLRAMETELARLPGLEQRYITLQRETLLLEETLKLLRREYEQAKIARESQESDLRLFEQAQLPRARRSERSAAQLLTGLLIGLLLGIGLAYALEYLDQTVKDPAEAEKLLDAPLLGTVPFIDSQHTLGLQSATLASAVIEPFRAVRANLRHIMAQQDLRTLMLCSAVKGEGKTTLAANLAVTFALEKRTVILIDCDLRRPQLHLLFDLPREHGVSEYLQGPVATDSLYKRTGYEHLYVITAGAPRPNPAELLSSARFHTLLQETAGRADIVFVDSPALLPVSDAVVMAPHADAIITVVRTRWTPARAARQAIAQLRRLGCRIAGGIVNGVSRTHGYYHYGYGNARRYGYQDEEHSRAESIAQRIHMRLKNAMFAFPRAVSWLSGLARALGRKPLFWVLCVLACAGIVSEQLLSRYDHTRVPEGIYLMETAASHVAKRYSPPPGRAEATADSVLAARIESWHHALLKSDTAALLDCYQLHSLVVHDSTGERRGHDALRAVLWLTAPDSIISKDIPVRLHPEPASRCTTGMRAVYAHRDIFVQTEWLIPLTGLPYIVRHHLRDTAPP